LQGSKLQLTVFLSLFGLYGSSLLQKLCGNRTRVTG
jgi:hypothetical protein